MITGDAREHIWPPLTNLVDNININVFGPECCGAELAAAHNSTLGAGAWTANLLVLVPLNTAEPLTVSQFFWLNGGTVDGSTDVGIYSFDGATRLISTGPTLNSGTSQIQVVDVADFVLSANTRFWLALGSDSGTQTYNRSVPLVGALDYAGVKQQAAGWSSGLPSWLTFAAPSVAVLPYFGFTGKGVI